MRLFEFYKSISETPIMDFGVHGDLDKPGSFHDPHELKMVQTAKWQQKLFKRFEFSKWPINLYIYNAPDARMTNYREYRTAVRKHHEDAPDYSQDGDEVISQHRTPDDDYHDIVSTMVKNSPLVVPSLVNMDQWSGAYTDDAFQKTFGFLPPNYQNCINVVLVQNYGAERVKLSPWIVAHRICHAMINSQTAYPRKLYTPYMEFDEFVRCMRGAMSIFGSVANYMWDKEYKAYKASGVEGPFISTWKRPTEKEQFAMLSNFASARNGKIERLGEYYVELATYWLLTGKLDFNYQAVIDRWPEAFRNKSGDIVDNMTAAECESAIEHLNNCFKAATGMLIVF